MPEETMDRAGSMNAASPIESRSGIVIDKEGAWFYNGLPIINRNIVRYFYGLLEEAPGGGYQLRNEREVCPVEVQDAPFVVTSLVPGEGPGKAFVIRLNDDTSEELDIKTLVIGADNVPYCRVKQGRFRARFLRAPYYRLAESIEQEGDSSFFIELDGERHYLNVP